MSSWRTIPVSEVSDAVRRLCIEANCDLPEDVCLALTAAGSREGSPLGQNVLEQLAENARIAARDRVPICQDTGFAVLFIDVGQDVHLVCGNLESAVNEGVRQGYTTGFLRKSIVREPAHARLNTGDNTPAIIHTRIVPGDQLSIAMMPKGGGAENMSRLFMLKPFQGLDGVIHSVLETVSAAGPNPCPPIIVGIGLGGTVDMVTTLAKRALLRPVGSKHPEARLAGLEEDLLDRINRLRIGAGGFGGDCTALAVFIEEMPCHMASLPLAVNVQCHAQRHKTVTL